MNEKKLHAGINIIVYLTIFLFLNLILNLIIGLIVSNIYSLEFSLLIKAIAKPSAYPVHSFNRDNSCSIKHHCLTLSKTSIEVKKHSMLKLRKPLHPLHTLRESKIIGINHNILACYCGIMNILEHSMPYFKDVTTITSIAVNLFVIIVRTKVS